MGDSWEGPAPPKPGCVLINLSSPPDAAVTPLSHIPSSGNPSTWLPAQLPMGRKDVPVTRPPMIFGDVLGKHLDGACSAGLCLCLLALEATTGMGPHPLGTEPFREGTHLCFFLSWLFCILLTVDIQCWGRIRRRESFRHLLV